MTETPTPYSPPEFRYSWKVKRQGERTFETLGLPRTTFAAVLGRFSPQADLLLVQLENVALHHRFATLATDEHLFLVSRTRGNDEVTP